MKTHVVKLDDLEEFLRENDFQVVRVDKRLWRWPPVIWVKRASAATAPAGASDALETTELDQGNALSFPFRE